MKIIILTFEGTYNDNGAIIKQDINVLLDTNTHEISAEKVNGGIPNITFDSFSHSYMVGEFIYSYANGDLTTVTFYNFYPFAKSDTDVKPPVVAGIVIDSIITSNQTAIGLNDGSAEINASGGVTPYEYSLNNVDWFDANIFINLTVGDYIAKVRSKSNTEQNSTSVFTILSAPLPPDPPQQPPVKDAIPILDPEILINDAYKRVRVKTVFGKAPSLLSNGDFEVYDGQNWQFWNKYGGINVSRIQRKVINSSGVEIPIENYALQFNEKANDTKYIEHTPILVNFGDTVKLGYRVGRTPGTGITRGFYKIGPLNVPAIYETVYIAKVRIKCGDLFLYNPDYGTTYQWLPQVATVGHKVDNPQGDLSTYSISIAIPACPITGTLTIQFFGFAKTHIITPASSITFTTVITEINEYQPIAIDDVSAVKTSQDSATDVDGMLSISDNLRFFSQTPDTIEILFGDLFYRNRYTDDLDNLYTIKYNDKPTNGWSEYGLGTSAYLPFGMGLAKSILTAYQMPFKKWYGGFKGDVKGFSYLDVFSFIVPNSTFYEDRYFEVLGMEINLKDNTANNVVLAENFRRSAKSNDITVPSYPDMPEPVFVQDPNATDNNGIFTEEFTEEFT